MRISYYKFKMANNVLKALKPKLAKMTGWDTPILSAYSNGREQGFHLNFYKDADSLGFSFSENRNSDDIVVYAGNEYKDFNPQGNIPNDKTYENKKYFRDGESAAKFIIEKLKVAK